MNMSSVNFDWHFSRRARIYGALYTYLNELLTIKNSTKHSCGVRPDELTRAIHQSQHTPPQSICHYTNTNRRTEGCMHTVNRTQIEKYDMEAGWCTCAAAANRNLALLWWVSGRFLRDRRTGILKYSLLAQTKPQVLSFAKWLVGLFTQKRLAVVAISDGGYCS